MKGMIVEIYKSHFGSCSNLGISSYNKEVLVVGEGIPELTEDNNIIPVIIIKKKKYGNRTYIHAEPIGKPIGIGWMAGGCFIWSCDSRFRKNISEQPVPLHDRQETKTKEEQIK